MIKKKKKKMQKDCDALSEGFHSVRCFAQAGAVLAFDLQHPTMETEKNALWAKALSAQLPQDCMRDYSLTEGCLRHLLYKAVLIQYSRCRSQGREKLKNEFVPWCQNAQHMEDLLVTARHKEVVHAVNGVESFKLAVHGEELVVCATNVRMANVEWFAFFHNIAAYAGNHFCGWGYEYVVPVDQWEFVGHLCTEDRTVDTQSLFVDWKSLCSEFPHTEQLAKDALRWHSRAFDLEQALQSLCISSQAIRTILDGKSDKHHHLMSVVAAFDVFSRVHRALAEGKAGMWKTEFKSKDLTKFFEWRRRACHDIGPDAPLLANPFPWPWRSGDKVRPEDVNFWCETLPVTLGQELVKARKIMDVTLQNLRGQLKVEDLLRQKNVLTTTVIIPGLESLVRNSVPC